jgi:hypothetical protein
MSATFIGAKIAAACGGLFGGLAVMAYMKPATILDAAIRGGISTGSAIIGSTLMIDSLEWSNSVEYHLISGAIIGFFAWSVLSMFGRFFVKAEKKQLDILDLVTAVKPTKELNTLIEKVKADPIDTKVKTKSAVNKNPRKKQSSSWRDL